MTPGPANHCIGIMGIMSIMPMVNASVQILSCLYAFMVVVYSFLGLQEQELCYRSIAKCLLLVIHVLRKATVYYNFCSNFCITIGLAVTYKTI